MWPDVSHWTDDAACKGKTDVMFPLRGDVNGVRHAKAICASCPVIDDCLEYVTTSPERYGVWAGIAGKEITEQRKRLQIIPNTLKHGSRSKYIGGCRCVHCSEANSLYMRRLRNSRTAV